MAGYEGRNYQQGADYNMQCYNFIPYCVSCPPTLVSDHTPGVQQMVDMILFASPAELADLVTQYHDRLLFSPTRNLLVVQGNGCNPDALASVVFLSSVKARELKTLGLRKLDEYLKASAAE
jgi:hypothetical protein